MPPKRDAAREMLVTALSGTLGSAVSKLITYPLEKTKTWLANKQPQESSSDVLRKLWRTGVYVGIKLRLSKNLFHSFIFFYVMEGITLLAWRSVRAVRRLRNLPLKADLTSLAVPVSLLAGFCGDALNVPVIAPLEYVLCQVMTSTTGEGWLSVTRRTFAERGLAGFYVGWTIYVLASFRPAVKYAIIEPMKALLLRDKGGRSNALSAGKAFWLGALSTAIASTLFYPLNTARIVISSRRRPCTNGKKGTKPAVPNGNNGDSNGDSNGDANGDANGDTDSEGVFEVMGAIVRKEGFKGLYKGLPSEIAESMLGAAILLVVKEQVTRAVRKAVYMTKA